MLAVGTYNPSVMLHCRSLAIAFLALLLNLASPQAPVDNPVVDAAKAIGQTGLTAKPHPKTSPCRFKPSGSRLFVADYVKGMFSDPQEREAFQPALEAMLDEYEKRMAPSPYANDAAAAIAYAVSVLNAAAHGEELAAEAFPKVVERMHAQFDTDPIRKSTDRQKQEAYEWAICSANLVLALLSQASSEEDQKSIRNLASAQLQALIGAKPSQITLNGKEISIKASGGTPSGETPGSMATGFAFDPPAGWAKNGEWYVYTTEERLCYTAAHVRFPPAIKASGNMGEALTALWKTLIPNGDKAAPGSMVYRRYLGSKLFSQFVFGKVRENQRDVDTLFTLFLIDCGDTWQPVVLAQTYEDKSMGEIKMTTIAQQHFPFSTVDSAGYAESLFKTLRCPNAPNQAMASREAISGAFAFGSGGMAQWVNVYTGATSMTFSSYSGTFNLKPDGSFTYTMVTSAGQVGAANYRGLKASGSYRIEGDLLICKYATYDQGDSYKRKEDRYRIAGVTAFSDGSKVVILMDDLDRPANAVTLSNGNYWYATKK